jgi:hypothetical protein
MPAAQVIPFESGTTRGLPLSGSSTGTFSEGNLAVSVNTETADGSSRAGLLQATDLYPFSEVEDGAVLQALRLLGTCIEFLRAVQEINGEVDYIAFDEQLMRARAALRDLFALRRIGDGFGALVSAILWALENGETEVLSRRQISAVIESLRALRRRPMMHFDSAMLLIDELEGAGLAVEPGAIDSLVGLEL